MDMLDKLMDFFLKAILIAGLVWIFLWTIRRWRRISESRKHKN